MHVFWRIGFRLPRNKRVITNVSVLQFKNIHLFFVVFISDMSFSSHKFQPAPAVAIHGASRTPRSNVETADVPTSSSRPSVKISGPVKSSARSPKFKAASGTAGSSGVKTSSGLYPMKSSVGGSGPIASSSNSSRSYGEPVVSASAPKSQRVAPPPPIKKKKVYAPIRRPFGTC